MTQLWTQVPKTNGAQKDSKKSLLQEFRGVMAFGTPLFSSPPT